LTKVLEHEIDITEEVGKNQKKVLLITVGNNPTIQMQYPDQPVRKGAANAVQQLPEPSLASQNIAQDSPEDFAEFLKQIYEIKRQSGNNNERASKQIRYLTKQGADTTMSVNTLKKYLKVIDEVILAKKAAGEQIEFQEKKREAATPEGKKAIADYKLFQSQKSVRRWYKNWLIRSSGVPKQEESTSPPILHKFLRDDYKTSPDAFSNPPTEKGDELEFIKDKLIPYQMQRRGYVFETFAEELAQNPQKFMGDGTKFGAEYDELIEKEKDPKIKPLLENTRLLFRQGKLNYLGKASGRELKNIKNYNKATEFEDPDYRNEAMFGENSDYAKVLEAKKIPYTFKKGKTDLVRRKKTAWYAVAKAIRGFLAANGISVLDQPEDSPLSQSVKRFQGNYATTKLTKDQMARMIELLEIEAKKSGEEGKYGKDALMMFRIGRGMGLRAEELFTISATEFENAESATEIEEDQKFQISGVNFNDEFKTELHKEGTYMIRAMTSKTKWIGKYTTTQDVADPELNKLIKEKMALKNTKSYYKETESNGYKVFLLIGEQDFYIQSSTIFNKNPKVSGLQKEHRDNLYNVLRRIYKEAGATKQYFQEHPVHALRHIMAQYWLFKTGYNYDFVAKRGHWNTISVLKDSYGAVSDDVTRNLLAAYSSIPDGESADEKLNESVGGKLGIETAKNQKAFASIDESKIQEILPLTKSDEAQAYKLIQEYPSAKENTIIKNWLKKYTQRMKEEEELKEQGLTDTDFIDEVDSDEDIIEAVEKAED
jgi:hypothetical protein